MAGNSWNPNATGTVGLEWAPTLSSGSVVDSDGRVAAQRLVSKSAETIANLRLYLDAVVGSTRRYLVDVYSGSEVSGASACALFVPNASTANTGWSIAGPGAAATVEAAIDDATGTCAAVVTEDQSQPTGWNAIVGAFGATVDLELNTGAFALNQRIADLTLGFDGSLEAVLQVYLVDVAGAQTYLLGELSGGIGSGFQRFSIALGELNPDTGEPWTPAELRTFDTGGFRIRIVRKTGTFGACSVGAMWLAVTSATETRVARAIATPTAAGWATFPVKAINTTTGVHSGNWSKANSVTHTYVLRRAYEPAGAPGSSVTWRYLQSTEALPVNVGTAGDGVVAVVAGLVLVAVTTVVGRGYGLVVVTSAPADSVDSQPFAALPAAGVASNEVRTGASAMQQELSGFAATTYGILRTLVRPFSVAGTTPVANLVVNLRRRSDSVLMGTWTLTPAAFTALAGSGTDWRVWQLRATSTFSLAAATQYYLEFTSTATAGAGWEVLRLDGVSQGAAATYEGTTNVATVAGADVNASDYVATVATVPTALAGLGVTQQTLSTGDTFGCAPESIPFARVDWTSSALAGVFDYYEVSRTEDAGATWTTIAFIQTEATSVFDDHEFRFGVATGYRVRVVRTDGAASDWTSTVSITIAAGACALFFTNNAAAASGLAYAESHDSLPAPSPFAFPDADEAVVRRVYGRDGFVVFRPTERRGERFQRTLLLNAIDAPADDGLPVFAPLRDLSLADLPYVCVRDQRGDRWFAAMLVPEGTIREPGRFYFAVVDVLTVSFTPAVVEVA